MKWFRVVDPVKMIDVLDRPVRDENGKEILLTHREFVLSRLVDPTFFEGKQGYEGALFVMETRQAINAQEAVWSKAGNWAQLEDEPWKRVVASCDNPKNPFDPRVQHNYVAFIKSMKEAVSEMPAEMRQSLS